MRAIDTNVVVRFLVRDDEHQAAKARAALAAGDIFVSLTVLLESAWVLDRAYDYAPHRVVTALRHIAGLPGITVEQPAVLAAALDCTEAGIDFADALHLAKADGCLAFLSFDRKLAKAATGRSPILVEEP